MRVVRRGFLPVMIALVLGAPPAGAHMGTFERNLQRIEESLEASRLAYQAGDIPAGSKAARRALALAEEVGPALLKKPATVAEMRRRADLLGDLGAVAIGEPQEAVAEVYLESSIRLYRASSGKASPELADALQALADLSLRQGQHERWESLMSEVLEVRILAHGESSPAVAETWFLLGVQAEADGELKVAEGHLRQAVDAWEGSGMSLSEDVGFMYLELAKVQQAQGDVAAAKCSKARGEEILRGHRPR
jgi:hypothetical protein